MAIFVNENTKVIVQGLTGGQGKYHGLRNRDYGTKIVGGVTPGKGGQDVDGIPIFDSVADAHPALTLVKLRVGESPLLARLTRRSAHALEITPGQLVYAQIKAVALESVRVERASTPSKASRMAATMIHKAALE